MTVSQTMPPFHVLYKKMARKIDPSLPISHVSRCLLPVRTHLIHHLVLIFQIILSASPLKPPVRTNLILHLVLISLIIPLASSLKPPVRTHLIHHLMLIGEGEGNREEGRGFTRQRNKITRRKVIHRKNPSTIQTTEMSSQIIPSASPSELPV